MIIKITRPQLKKLIAEQGSIRLFVGNIHNGIFWSGCYNIEVRSMEEVESAMLYAKHHGWQGKLHFGIVK